MDGEFSGITYDTALDYTRLSTAMARVYALMRDGRWRTLSEIAEAAQCSEAGASARLRDLRKDRFVAMYPNAGVKTKRQSGGLYVYRVVPVRRQLELF